jgi:FdhD protein
MKRYTLQGWEEGAEASVTESSVALNVNGKAWVTLQCLPEDLEALAAGFLFNEGVIQTREEITLLQVCPDSSLVDAWLAHPAERPVDWRITSGCGGGQSAALDKAIPVLPDSPPVSPALILQISADFIARSQQERTPGTHASALYNAQKLDGGPVSEESRLCIDIGRHNTLDKLAGTCLLGGRSPAGMALITSGRVSADMLQKAARMGTPIVVSLRSATSLAVQLAASARITLITHARRGSFDLLNDSGRLSA